MLRNHDPAGFYCEMTHGSASQPVRERLEHRTTDDLKRRASDAEAEFHGLGITFTVYSEKDGIDRVLPFDIIPRVLSAQEWMHIEGGLVQRIAALNLLLDDLCHDRTVLSDGVIPADLILGNANYRLTMRGFDLPHKTYVHICGTDLVRDKDGTVMVLEDNARLPSGVSYVVENRHTMSRSPVMLTVSRIGCRSSAFTGMKRGSSRCMGQPRPMRFCTSTSWIARTRLPLSARSAMRDRTHAPYAPSSPVRCGLS